MMLRKFILFLFILLQGMAPLLHAHAGTPHHGGIHLPDGFVSEAAPGQVTPAQSSDDPPAFTLDDSLEAQDLTPILGGPMLAFRQPIPATVPVASWIPIAYENPLTLGIHRLTPPTCAPPRA